MVLSFRVIFSCIQCRSYFEITLWKFPTHWFHLLVCQILTPKIWQREQASASLSHRSHHPRRGYICPAQVKGRRSNARGRRQFQRTEREWFKNGSWKQRRWAREDDLEGKMVSIRRRCLRSHMLPTPSLGLTCRNSSTICTSAGWVFFIQIKVTLVYRCYILLLEFSWVPFGSPSTNIVHIFCHVIITVFKTLERGSLPQTHTGWQR